MKGSKTRKIIALMLIIFIIIATSNVYINKVSAAEAVTGNLKYENTRYSGDLQVLFGLLDEDGEYVDFDEKGAAIGKNNNYEFRVEINGIDSRELIYVSSADWSWPDPVYPLVEGKNGDFEERALYK